MIGFAKKVGMTRIFVDGVSIPVTALQFGTQKVVQRKTKDKDGYNAVQVGAYKKTKSTKARLGHLSKHGSHEQNFLCLGEFDFEASKEAFDINDFVEQDLIDITGNTIGRGFTGAVKRHGFAGQPKSHGHDHVRAVGSIGAMYPQRVLPGTKMAGRTGNAQRTLKKVKIVAIDKENSLIFVKGSVTGANSSYLKIQKVNY